MIPQKKKCGVRRVYVDGFLKFEGMENGCSVVVEDDEESIVYKGRFLINTISNRRLKKLSEKNKITNFVVEYFAIYMGLRVAYKYSADVLYSDSEVVVKQLNKKYMVHNKVLRYWFYSCARFLKQRVPGLRILWISRGKMIEVLGH